MATSKSTDSTLTKPRRPLTAYNLFYRYKRAKLIEAKSANNGDIEKKTVADLVATPTGLESYPDPASVRSMFPPDKVDGVRRTNIRLILEQQLLAKDTSNRQHRKAEKGGFKMSFTEMNTIMVASWKKSDEFTKTIFKELADEGRAVYQKALAEYNSKLHAMASERYRTLNAEQEEMAKSSPSMMHHAAPQIGNTIARSSFMAKTGDHTIQSSPMPMLHIKTDNTQSQNSHMPMLKIRTGESVAYSQFGFPNGPLPPVSRQNSSPSLPLLGGPLPPVSRQNSASTAPMLCGLTYQMTGPVSSQNSVSSAPYQFGRRSSPEPGMSTATDDMNIGLTGWRERSNSFGSMPPSVIQLSNQVAASPMRQKPSSNSPTVVTPAMFVDIAQVSKESSSNQSSSLALPPFCTLPKGKGLEKASNETADAKSQDDGRPLSKHERNVSVEDFMALINTLSED